jgi:hypothetical protein
MVLNGLDVQLGLLFAVCSSSDFPFVPIKNLLNYFVVWKTPLVITDTGL